MSYFAVIREAGAAWVDGKSMREQRAWGEHADFMNALEAEGFEVLGGPLAESDKDRVRALLIVNAASESEIRRRLEDDPWTRMELLSITSIESYEILSGLERIEAATPKPER